MVDLGGVFHPFGGLMGAPGVTAGGLGLLWLGWRPTTRWMDCLKDFGHKGNIFILAVLAHFHILQYAKIKWRLKIILKSFSYSPIQTCCINFETSFSSLILMQEMWLFVKKLDFVPHKDGNTGTCQRSNFWVPLASSCTHVMYWEI